MQKRFGLQLFDWLPWFNGTKHIRSTNMKYSLLFALPILTPFMAAAFVSKLETGVDKSPGVYIPVPPAMKKVEVPVAAKKETTLTEKGTFRIQFGAFTEEIGASALETYLDSKGVPSSVVQKDNLILVVSDSTYQARKDALHKIASANLDDRSDLLVHFLKEGPTAEGNLFQVAKNNRP